MWSFIVAFFPLVCVISIMIMAVFIGGGREGRFPFRKLNADQRKERARLDMQQWKFVGLALIFGSLGGGLIFAFIADLPIWIRLIFAVFGGLLIYAVDREERKSTGEKNGTAPAPLPSRQIVAVPTKQLKLFACVTSLIPVILQGVHRPVFVLLGSWAGIFLIAWLASWLLYFVLHKVIRVTSLKQQGLFYYAVIGVSVLSSMGAAAPPHGSLWKGETRPLILLLGIVGIALLYFGVPWILRAKHGSHAPEAIIKTAVMKEDTAVMPATKAGLKKNTVDNILKLSIAAAVLIASFGVFYHFALRQILIDHTRKNCIKAVHETFAKRRSQQEKIDSQLEQEWATLVEQGRVPSAQARPWFKAPDDTGKLTTLDRLVAEASQTCTGGLCEDALKEQQIQQWKKERYRDVYWPDAKTEAGETEQCGK